jgi:hypothetical protein
LVAATLFSLKRTAPCADVAKVMVCPDLSDIARIRVAQALPVASLLLVEITLAIRQRRQSA